MQPEIRRPALLRNFMDAVLAVVFPTQCSLCGNELASDSRGRVCHACWDTLRPWDGPLCARCGLPFVSAHAADAVEPRCGDCLAEVPAFDGARSYGLYTGKLRQAVLRVKFSSDERLGRHLGGLLAFPWDRLAHSWMARSPLIAPVPLHRLRRKERGFNQSELLAEGLIRTLAKRDPAAKVTIARSLLVRRRPTSPQTGLSVSARRENLRGAFEVERPDLIRGRDIVLVDDVMTTGATLSECARALKRAGVASVWGLTVARATPLFPDLATDLSNNPVDGFSPNSR